MTGDSCEPTEITISEGTLLAQIPPQRHLDELHQLGLIGYVRGIEAKLSELEEIDPTHIPFVTDMRALVKSFELKQYMSVLEALRDREI